MSPQSLQQNIRRGYLGSGVGSRARSKGKKEFASGNEPRSNPSRNLTLPQALQWGLVDIGRFGPFWRWNGLVVLLLINPESAYPSMLPGVRVHDVNKRIDERGFFAEIVRNDWKDFLDDDTIAQANVSLSYPGMIRAWHRHRKGQVDYLMVVKGTMKICAYDDKEDSSTRGHLDEIIASEEKLQLVRVPGHYWHGTMTLGVQPSLA